MAQAKPTSAVTLYSNKFVLAEFGGTVFWVTDAQAMTTRYLHLGQRVGGCHHAIYRDAERQQETVCVDQVGGRHVGESRARTPSPLISPISLIHYTRSSNDPKYKQ